MRFAAKVAEFTDEGGCTTLALADDEFQPTCSVVISATNQPDDQDRATMTAGIHVIIGTNIEGYDLIRSIALDGTNLEILLKESKLEHLTISVDTSEAELDNPTLKKAVAFLSSRLQR